MIVEAVEQVAAKHWSGSPPCRPPARSGIEAYVAALALIVLLVPLHRWWPAQVLLVPLLLTVPGVILLRALRIPARIVSSFPVYIPCAAIIVLFGSALAVDMVGPFVGVAAPLRSVPLLVSFEVTCLALLATSLNARPEVGDRVAAACAVRPACLASRSAPRRSGRRSPPQQRPRQRCGADRGHCPYSHARRDCGIFLTVR